MGSCILDYFQSVCNLLMLMMVWGYKKDKFYMQSLWGKSVIVGAVDRMIKLWIILMFRVNHGTTNSFIFNSENNSIKNPHIITSYTPNPKTNSYHSQNNPFNHHFTMKSIDQLCQYSRFLSSITKKTLSQHHLQHHLQHLQKQTIKTKHHNLKHSNKQHK